jgi:hypothetical protein
MRKKNRTAECGHTQPSRSIRTDRVVPAAFEEQYRNDPFGTQLPADLLRKLRHRDRWRVQDMLAEREQYSDISDIEVWRRLYLPRDLVRVGDVLSPAHVAPPAEYCCGCTWSADGTPRDSVAYCLSAADLLRGATCAERMSPREACEAVLGRMRAADLPILLVTDDGQHGVEAWIDASLSACEGCERGRCPGGINSGTGRVHRVLWAYEGLWHAGWSDEEWAADAAHADCWLDAHLDRLIAGQGSRKEVA